jgi:group II intron reverse transcriptase/maturase
MHNTLRKNLVFIDRGRRNLKLERVYRELYDEERYLQCYGRLYPNEGAMTPGVTTETVDGMSLEKIRLIIQSLREGTFAWKPTKRVYIPKRNGKMRPLGLPTWTDKLVQDVMRSILEPYYESRFRDCSHGFRPDRGCHTALQACRKSFRGAVWFIEGDIKGCFDNVDHDVLLNILRESIDDERFLRLVRDMLEAGYLEDWNYHGTYAGTPQGGVISPLLANVYLHKLDEFVEDSLIPRYTRGRARKRNPAYTAIVHAMARAKAQGNQEEWYRLKQEQREVRVGLANDPNFRRLTYVRYADDFLLAFIGSKAEAEGIKGQIGEFLGTNLKLTMSEEKTLITHAATDKARFLGYDLKVIHDDQAISTGSNALGKHTKRAINGKLRLEVPMERVTAMRGKFMEGEKVVHRKEQLTNGDYSIVTWFDAIFRGFANYYAMAHDRARKLLPLKYVVETSMLKTLANKHRSTVSEIARKYKVRVDTPHGKRKAFRVVVERPNKKPLVATFGGYSLGWEQGPKVITDVMPRWWRNSRTEILQRMLADKCEYCGKEGPCEVHHIRKLAPLLKRKGLAGWKKMMAMRKRKTLALCRECHDKIHAGTLD